MPVVCRYVPEDMVVEGVFNQLVSGVIWLVRRGKSYVDASKEAECSDSQESGMTWHNGEGGREGGKCIMCHTVLYVPNKQNKIVFVLIMIIVIIYIIV